MCTVRLVLSSDDRACLCDIGCGKNCQGGKLLIGNCAAVYCVSGDNGEPGLYWATSDNEETCDVIEVPLP